MTYSIYRSFSDQEIRDILADDRLNKLVTADGNTSMFAPSEQQNMYYIVAAIDSKPIGFCLFHMFNDPICFQMHVNYLSEHWGTKLYKATDKVCSWIFNNTEALKLVALCPSNRPDVIGHVRKAGFTQEGVLTKASSVSGELCDSFIMGRSKC